MASHAQALDGARFEQLAREAVARHVAKPDLEAMALVFNVIRVANRIGYDLETHVHRSSGLSRAAFRVLFAVWVAGPISPNQLARLSNVSPASISSVLNTLERAELIVRRRVAADRRVVEVALTGKGEETIPALWIRHHERERSWAAALTAEQRRTLVELLRILVRHHPSPGDLTQTTGGVES